MKKALKPKDLSDAVTGSDKTGSDANATGHEKETTKRMSRLNKSKREPDPDSTDLATRLDNLARERKSEKTLLNP